MSKTRTKKKNKSPSPNDLKFYNKTFNTKKKKSEEQQKNTQKTTFTDKFRYNNWVITLNCLGGVGGMGVNKKCLRTNVFCKKSEVILYINTD